MNKMLKRYGIVALLALAGAFEASAQLRGGLLGRNRSARGASAAAPAAAEATTATAEASAATTEEGAVSDLNFKEAPIEMIFEVYGKLVDRTVLKDPATPSATITLESRPGQKLSKEEQIEAIEVVCEMNGIHFEKYGEKFVRALPRKEAGKEGIPLYMDAASEELEAEPMGKVVSVMLNFKNISAQEEALKALEGFKSNSGLLQVFERTNSILVTDTKQNFLRMLAIARTIDIATPVLENVYVRQIKNASATDIKTALEQIVTESQKELEKSGKAQQNAQASAATRSVQSSGPLLRRPNQPKDAPAAPTPLESLVTSVSDADRGLIRGKVLILADERSNKLVVITSKSNMDFFDRVIEQLDVETTPDTLVKVYRLKYAEAEDVSDMINDLIGNSASAKNSGAGRGNQNQNAKSGSGGNLTRNSPSGSNTASKSPANQRTGEPKAGELSKDNTTVLADKRINGLVVMTQKELVPTIENIIESMDVRLSQVLIETVIIEVSLGDDLHTGIDWVQRGKARAYSQETKNGMPLYYGQDDNGNINTGVKLWSGQSLTTTTGSGEDATETTYSASSVPAMALGTVRDASAGFMNNGNYMLGGGGGEAGAGALLQQLVGASTNATQVLSPIGGGLNYFLKSDKLNLAAIIQASKNDSRSKYLASPVIMTVDNKEASIEATEMRYLFKGYQYSGSTYSGSPVKDYEQKELGITVKVTPKINPNGTVMLKVEETYSQEGSGQVVDGEKQATTVTRKMSADVVLENMQSVVFGGLTQTVVTESESGIPILKDIPYIGKWLFGSVSQTENRQELLVFMTPYVLDDAEAAQAEAFRRKRALSDQNAWNDRGWSASKLADPMPKKEQMRRFKEEWKKQDEERKTRLAIEKMKLDRAKALEAMDESERKFWIETHREELEREERERFDEFMKEQADNRALVEEIKRKEMERAQAKIDAADEAAHNENERGRLERNGQLPVKKRDEEVDGEPSPTGESTTDVTPAEPLPDVTPAEPVPAAIPEEPAVTPEEPAAVEPAANPELERESVNLFGDLAK